MTHHLLVTNDFPPKTGGIQSYLWELWRRLPSDSTTVLTTPHVGSEAWDAAQPFRVERSRERVLLPTPSLRRRIDRLAEEVDARIVLLDPALPLGVLGPSLERPYGLVVHGAEVAIPGRLPRVEGAARACRARRRAGRRGRRLSRGGGGPGGRREGRRPLGDRSARRGHPTLPPARRRAAGRHPPSVRSRSRRGGGARAESAGSPQGVRSADRCRRPARVHPTRTWCWPSPAADATAPASSAGRRAAARRCGSSAGCPTTTSRSSTAQPTCSP